MQIVGILLLLTGLGLIFHITYSLAGQFGLLQYFWEYILAVAIAGLGQFLIKE